MRKLKPIEFDVDHNGCFVCTSHARDLDGYPLVKRNRKMIRISRYIYESCFGFIPEGQVIRHKCDNPKCINPEHLEPGTHKQNSVDMVKRNRQASGEKNGSVRLTNDEVLAIRKAKSNHSFKEIGEMFGITKEHAKRIVWRKTWKHI